MNSVEINSETETSPQVPKNDSQGPSIEMSKKKRKKELKSIDYILRTISNCDASEDKLIALYHKFLALQQEEKDGLYRVKHLEKGIQSVLGERDQLQNDRTRLILQKEKLESLCRELQKQNNLIKEESLVRARTEEDKRREVADHFQTSVVEIQKQLTEYQSKNNELRMENQTLAEKLLTFIKEHEKRQEHVDKVMKTRDLELKLADAKLSQANCRLDEEKARSAQRIIQLQEEVKLSAHRMEAHLLLEEKLKEQIEFYKNKYQEFNKTMANSNELFTNAKKEMEKMNKRIRQAESQAMDWRGKWEIGQRGLLELADELTKEKVSSASLTRQVERLGGLCRALQSQSSKPPPSAAEDDAASNLENVNKKNAAESGDIVSQEAAAASTTNKCSMPVPEEADSEPTPSTT